MKALVEEKEGPEGECGTRNEVFDHNLRKKLLNLRTRCCAIFMYEKIRNVLYKVQ